MFYILYRNELDLSLYLMFLHPSSVFVINVNIVHQTFPFFYGTHSRATLSHILELR